MSWARDTLAAAMDREERHLKSYRIRLDQLAQEEEELKQAIAEAEANIAECKIAYEKVA